MPEEIFVIIIVAIGAGTLSGIVSQIIGYLKSRTPEKPLQDNSLTTSELEGMMRKWIVDATQPLASRMDNIEQKLTGEQPAQISSKSILDDMDTYEQADGEKELASKTRSKG